MSKALVRQGEGGGVVPAVCSVVVPGLGQLVNGETDKAVGVFVVAAICGAGAVASLPLIGPIAGVVGVLTWGYGVLDAYASGKKKR
jgi:TM2 domain-containing membrane protein YozV